MAALSTLNVTLIREALQRYRFQEFPIERTYAAFTVNAVSDKGRKLALHFKHTVKLNFLDAD